MQIKILMRYHYTFMKMAKIKNTNSTLNVAEDVEQSQILYITGGTRKWYNSFGKDGQVFHKSRHRSTLQSSNSTLKRNERMFPKNTCTKLFTEALIISQTLEIAQMSINRTVNNLECSCNEILYSNKKTMNYWYNSMNKFPNKYTVQEAQCTQEHIWYDSIYMIKGPSCLWLEQNSSLS